MLLSHGAAEDARDKNWQTPAHVAAANNAVSCMRLLIPAMSNVNITDRMGRDDDGDIQQCVCSVSCDDKKRGCRMQIVFDRNIIFLVWPITIFGKNGISADNIGRHQISVEH